MSFQLTRVPRPVPTIGDASFTASGKVTVGGFGAAGCDFDAEVVFAHQASW